LQNARRHSCFFQNKKVKSETREASDDQIFHSFAESSTFRLNASKDCPSVLAGDLGLLLVMSAHGSGFPLTDALSHQLWAEGFPNIFSLDENVEDAHRAGRNTSRTRGFGAD
jgi:hypothetical protein